MPFSLSILRAAGFENYARVQEGTLRWLEGRGWWISEENLMINLPFEWSVSGVSSLMLLQSLFTIIQLLAAVVCTFKEHLHPQPRLDYELCGSSRFYSKANLNWDVLCSCVLKIKIY